MKLNFFDLYSRNIFRKICNLKAQVPEVSSLEIFSDKNISHEGIINLTNDKGLYVQKTEKHFWHAISTQYAVIMSRNGGWVIRSTNRL